jgi:hypothetical protein
MQNQKSGSFSTVLYLVGCQLDAINVKYCPTHVTWGSSETLDDPKLEMTLFSEAHHLSAPATGTIMNPRLNAAAYDAKSIQN